MRTTVDNDLKERLRETESALAVAREELDGLRVNADKARRAYAAKPNLPTDSREFKAAEAAVKAQSAKEEEVAQLQARQVAILKLFPRGAHGRNGNGPRNADGLAGGDPWGDLARSIDLEGGVTRVEVNAADLLGSGAMAAGLNVTPSSGWTAPSYLEEGIVSKGRDERHIYQTLPEVRVEEQDLALTEFRQSGTRGLVSESPAVERDPLATGEKAQLGLSLELATPALKQFAAVVSEVPSQLFTSVEALRGFLQDELAYQIRVALDAHVISQVTAATPPHSKTGADLIAQVRNALAAARALGALPTVLALTPAEAATLDLTKTELGYIFALAASGSSSPLFGMQIVEVPSGLAAPLLIDPQLLGRMYLAQALLLIDPFSGMSKNQVRVRLEVNGLAHVRDVSGAYQVKT